MMKKKLLLTTLTFGMLAITAYSCNLTSGNRSEGNPNDSIVAEPQEHHLSVLIAGDLMQHEPQIKGALQRDGSYDYE